MHAGQYESTINVYIQGSPQEIKVEVCGILIFINIDHESH